jgi:hypothetical protein
LGDVLLGQETGEKAAVKIDSDELAEIDLPEGRIEKKPAGVHATRLAGVERQVSAVSKCTVYSF